MNINSEEVRRNAEKVIEKSDRLVKLTKAEGWADFVELLDFLVSQEIRALSGQPLDHNYYKKIGFIQQVAFIRALPTVVKDGKIREYLLHQGRAVATKTIVELPFLYLKKKSAAMEQLNQILNPTNLEEGKEKFINESYKNS